MAVTGKTFVLKQIGFGHHLHEFEQADIGARLAGVAWIVNRALGQPRLAPCDRLTIATVAGSTPEASATFLRVTDASGTDKDLVPLQPEAFKGWVRWLYGTSSTSGLTWYLMARTDGRRPDGAPCRRLVIRSYEADDTRIRPPQMELDYVNGRPSEIPEPACDSPPGRNGAAEAEEEGDGYKQD